MSFAIQTGPNWVLREQRFIYDILRGTQIISVYEGTPDGIAQVRNGLQRWEKAEEDSSDSPRIRLTVTSPDPGESTVWELITNLKQKKPREHPKYRGVSQKNLLAIDDWFDTSPPRDPNGPDWTLKKEQAALTPPQPPLAPDGSEGIAAELWSLEVTEQTYWSEDVVLRFTTTVTNAVQVALAYKNFNHLFSTAQLLNPAVSGLIIPPATQVSILEANLVPDTSVDSWLTWSWLKMKPQSRQRQIGKLEIAGEFWLNLWNNKLYDFAS